MILWVCNVAYLLHRCWCSCTHPVFPAIVNLVHLVALFFECLGSQVGRLYRTKALSWEAPSSEKARLLEYRGWSNPIASKGRNYEVVLPPDQELTEVSKDKVRTGRSEQGQSQNWPRWARKKSELTEVSKDKVRTGRSEQGPCQNWPRWARTMSELAEVSKDNARTGRNEPSQNRLEVDVRSQGALVRELEDLLAHVSIFAFCCQVARLPTKSFRRHLAKMEGCQQLLQAARWNIFQNWLCRCFCWSLWKTFKPHKGWWLINNPLVLTSGFGTPTLMPPFSDPGCLELLRRLLFNRRWAERGWQ